MGGYEVQVLADGVPAPTYNHAGETYIMGNLGGRYTLRVTNHTGRRIEAVVSVDGRDVIDGKAADFRKRGYLVPAWGSVDIDGWRISHAEVAAFRFASVADSYAARTGSARDVGVIGVAVFPERYYPPPRPLYSPPPPPPWRRWHDDREGYYYDRDAAPSADASRPAEKSSGGRGEAPPVAAAPPAPSGRSSSGDEAYAGSELARPRSRPGLGTEFGEAMGSQVQEVSFTRADGNRPAMVLGARYNDRDGLLALGIDVDRRYYGGYYGDDDLSWRQTATPFPGSSDRRYAAPPAGWHPGCCSGY